MPATITTSTIAAGYTQQTLTDALVAVFETVWGAPVGRYTSGTALRSVFAVPALAAGDRSLFFVLDVSSTFSIQCGTTVSFTAPSTIGTVQTQSSASFSTTSSPINLTFIRLPGELTLLCLNQGSSQRGFYGLITPATLSPWWVRANASPWLLVSSSVFSIFSTHTAAPHAYGSSPTNVSTTYSNFSAVSMLTTIYENPALLRREVLPHFSYCAQFGLAGFSSAELAQAATNGLSQWDTVVVSAGVEEYLLFSGPGNQAWVVRTV